MSNYFSNGNDLDNILEPRQPGDPTMTNVRWADRGTDLSDIYAPASVGSPAPNIFFLKGTSDIGPLFCKKGLRITIDTRDIVANAQTLYFDSGPAYSTARIEWNTAEAGGDRWAFAAGPGGSGDTSPFEWLQSGGNTSDYRIRATQTTGDAITGSALDTWHPGGSAVTLSLTVSETNGASEAKGAAGTYEIERISSGVTLGSGSWSLDASVLYSG